MGAWRWRSLFNLSVMRQARPRTRRPTAGQGLLPADRQGRRAEDAQRLGPRNGAGPGPHGVCVLRLLGGRRLHGDGHAGRPPVMAAVPGARAVTTPVPVHRRNAGRAAGPGDVRRVARSRTPANPLGRPAPPRTAATPPRESPRVPGAPHRPPTPGDQTGRSGYQPDFRKGAAGRLGAQGPAPRHDLTRSRRGVLLRSGASLTLRD